MIRIEIHRDCQDDLHKIAVLDSIAATRFAATIQQIKSDPSLLDVLLTHGARQDIFDVKKWVRLQNGGDPIWRLRFIDFAYRDPDYRIFYVVSADRACIYFLAIVRRNEIDYDNPQDSTACRIIGALERLRSTVRF